MLHKKLFFLAALLLAMVSCGDEEVIIPQPVAEFSYEVDGLTVTFEDLSKNHDPNLNVWDMGDGKKKSGRTTFEYTFKESGSYDVTLTVESKDVNESGVRLSSKVTYEITVKDPTPTKVVVTKIVVNKIKFETIFGDPCDEEDGPDIMIEIYENGSHIYWGSDRRFDNATEEDLPITLNCDVTLDILNNYIFNFIDYDGYNDEGNEKGTYMLKEISFIPRDWVADKPQSLYWENTKQDTNIEIHLEWK